MPKSPRPTLGGMEGAVRAILLASPDITNLVGDRIQPGAITIGKGLDSTAPYITTSDVGSVFSKDMEFFDPGTKKLVHVDCYDSQLQVTVTATSFEQMRDLTNRLVAPAIRAGNYYSVNGLAVWLQPTTKHYLDTKQKDENGRDIWQGILRYRYLDPVPTTLS